MATKGVVRSIKNYAKGFSDVQIKVREATSNDSWGPSGSLMNEIAQLTYNEQDFIEIMDMLDRRLNDKGKNWRHVFKALLVLDYCLHVGSENVVLYAKENIYVIRTLKEFQHVDDNGKDVGFNVRQKAKDITSLLMDDQRLKDERRSRHQMQERMAGVGDYMNDVMWGGKANGSGGEDAVYKRPGYMDEDGDLKRAIEESKRLAEQQGRSIGDDDADLKRALEESAQEARDAERKKREALERENQNNLFGTPSQPSQQMFQNFPSQQTFDSSLNPYGQQQQQQQQQWPQSTGFTGMSFAEPIHHQQQQQPVNNPYNTFNLQAQMTGMPSQITAQQQTNPFGGNNMFSSIQSQPTGMFATPVQQQQQQPFQTQVSTPTTTTTSTNTMDTQYSKLNSMLQNRDDGMDTFGNTGNLRIPYGTGFASSLQQQKSITDSPSDNNSLFSQPFGQQPSRNPFGQTSSSSGNNVSQGQKSLLEMMQDQKQQQLLQAQMTGYQQPQMTGFPQQQAFQQPQMTGFQPQQQAFQQQQMTGFQPQQPQNQFQPSFF